MQSQLLGLARPVTLGHTPEKGRNLVLRIYAQIHQGSIGTPNGPHQATVFFLEFRGGDWWFHGREEASGGLYSKHAGSPCSYAVWGWVEC